jgi:hypothetical protein
VNRKKSSLVKVLAVNEDETHCEWEEMRKQPLRAMLAIQVYGALAFPFGKYNMPQAGASAANNPRRDRGTHKQQDLSCILTYTFTESCYLHEEWIKLSLGRLYFPTGLSVSTQMRYLATLLQ